MIKWFVRIIGVCALMVLAFWLGTKLVGPFDKDYEGYVAYCQDHPGGMYVPQHKDKAVKGILCPVKID